MILSTLHKTTGTTHDLYSLRETIDFFPLHKSENALSLPRRAIIFIGIYPKTTAQGYTYKNIRGSNSLYRGWRSPWIWAQNPNFALITKD